MKTASALILLLLIPLTNLFGQEWKWRGQRDNLLKQRTLKTTGYKNHVFRNKADFRHSTFMSRSDFSNANFDSVADFNFAYFNATADFTKTHFHSTAWFTKTHFDTKAGFIGAYFDSSADFNLANFSSTAYFIAAYFNGKTDFTKTHFHSTARFTEAHFHSTAEFLATRFDSTVDFYATHFDRSANFKATHFNSTAVFWETRFDDTCSFKFAQFNDGVSFESDTLPEYLDFSNVTRIKNQIDLTRNIINPEYGICHINLTDASVEKFRFMYKGFRLWFPPSDTIDYEKKTNVYIQLLNVQKKEGFTESYEILDKEYKKLQYTDPDGPYSKHKILGYALNWINKNWWGYGFNKELIITNVILILLLFSIINSFFLSHLTTHVYRNEKIKKMIDEQKQRSLLRRWFVSLPYSLFYTAIIFFSLKFDMEKLNYAENLNGWKIFNLAYFVLLYLGGLVCLAYLANYVITV